MTYEKGLFAQADPEIVSGSTIERKKMSTKTIYKRIALVAVAALGAGVLSVAPANATAASIATLGTPVRTGVNTWTVSLSLSVTGADDCVADADASDYTLTAGATTPLEATAPATGVVTFASTAVTVSNTAGTGSSSTAAIVTGVITVTSATSAAATNIAATAGAYAGKIALAGAGDCDVAESAATTFTIGSAAAGSFVTGIYAAGSTTSAASQIVNGQATLGFIQGSGDTSYTITSTGVGSIVSTTATVAAGTAGTAAVNLNGLNPAGGISWTPASVIQKLAILTTSAVAGVQTISFQPIGTAGAPGTAITATITWGAAPAALVASASESTVFLGTGTGSSAISADDAAFTLASTAAATVVANIQVTVNDQNGDALNGQKLTVSISGPGSFGVDKDAGAVTTATNSRSYVDSAVNSGNVWTIGIAADGVAGKSTVTVSVGTTVLATKSLTFYGATASYTATSQYIATANGVPSTDAVIVCALDSASNFVPSQTIYAYSGSTALAAVEASGSTRTAAITAASGTMPTSHVAITPIGCVGFDVTGVSQTTGSSVVITFGNAATLATSTITKTATVALGGVTADSVVLTANKATYTPGEAMTLTLTFKDANGRLVAGGAGTGTLAGELVSSVSTIGTKFAANNATTVGTITATVYAPLASGPLVFTGTTATVAGSFLTATNISKAITATVAVSDSATMSALTTLINSLIAKINALNKLVIKIQKKVKA
jgi:hypothetical protein